MSGQPMLPINVCVSNFVLLLQILQEFIGRDATDAFEGVGHSMAARASLARFRVGVIHEADKA
jgi:hypothetical protein